MSKNGRRAHVKRAKHLRGRFPRHTGGTAVWPICNACENENTSKAVYRWNTRPREAALDAEIAGLRIKLADARISLDLDKNHIKAQDNLISTLSIELEAYKGKLTAVEMREQAALLVEAFPNPFKSDKFAAGFAAALQCFPDLIRALSDTKKEG